MSYGGLLWIFSLIISFDAPFFFDHRCPLNILAVSPCKEETRKSLYRSQVLLKKIFQYHLPQSFNFFLGWSYNSFTYLLELLVYILYTSATRRFYLIIRMTFCAWQRLSLIWSVASRLLKVNPIFWNKGCRAKTFCTLFFLGGCRRWK